MVAGFQAVFWVEKRKTSDILRPSPQITQGHFCSILLVKTSHKIIPDSRVEKSDSISKKNWFFFRKFLKHQCWRSGTRQTVLLSGTSEKHEGGPRNPRSITITPRAPTRDLREAGTQDACPSCTQRGQLRGGGLGSHEARGVPPWPSLPTESCLPEAPLQWGPQRFAGHRRRCHRRASGTWMNCLELSRSIVQGLCRAQHCSRKSPPLFPPSWARGPLARQQGDRARVCAARRTRTFPRCEVVGETSGVWPEPAPQPSTHYRPPMGREKRRESRTGNQESSCVCHDLPSLVWCSLGLGLAENDITTSICPYIFFFFNFLNFLIFFN